MTAIMDASRQQIRASAAYAWSRRYHRSVIGMSLVLLSLNTLLWYGSIPLKTIGSRWAYAGIILLMHAALVYDPRYLVRIGRLMQAEVGGSGIDDYLTYMARSMSILDAMMIPLMIVALGSHLPLGLTGPRMLFVQFTGWIIGMVIYSKAVERYFFPDPD